LIGTEGVSVLFSRVEQETSSEDDTLDPVLWQHANVNADVDREGSFESEALPYGEYEAHLSMPAAQIPISGGWISSGHSISLLQTVLLDRDVVELEVATLPQGGSLEVFIITDGAPAVGHTVVLVSDVKDGDKGTMGDITDEQGVARFPAVMAGDWTLHVAPRNASWSAADDVPIRIGPGVKHTHTFAIRLHEHVLRIEDPDTGDALADTLISLKVDFGNSWTESPKKTDAHGNLSLRLPRGTHVLQLRGPDRKRLEASVQWEAGGATPNPLQFGTAQH